MCELIKSKNWFKETLEVDGKKGGEEKAEVKKEGKAEEEKEELKTESKEEDEESETKKEHKKQGCNNDEILAVLSHELGHWKLGHVLKNFVISQVRLLKLFEKICL